MLLVRWVAACRMLAQTKRAWVDVYIRYIDTTTCRRILIVFIGRVLRRKCIWILVVM